MDGLRDLESRFDKMSSELTCKITDIESGFDNQFGVLGGKLKDL